MKFYCIFVIIFCVFVSADGRTLGENGAKGVLGNSNRGKRDCDCSDQKVIMVPTYGMYLIGFTMFFMLLAIIILAVALYTFRKNKRMFGLNADNTQYVRQESTGVIPLCSSNYDEQKKNHESTLTMNSGVIEISEPRISEPETPTRLEDSKIIFTKKPFNPIVPVMPRGQMDAICREVLKRVQKSDSASFRDLNELLNSKNDEKPENKCDVEESEKEKGTKKDEKEETKIESQQPKQEIDEIDIETKAEPQKEIKMEIQNDVKQDEASKPTNEIENEIQPEVNNDVQIEVPKVEINKSTDVSESETEYDMVPSPIPFRHSGPETENYATDDGFAVYDLPPRRSHDGLYRNVIQMDQDSQYLLPISGSRENIESCYVNAKTPPSK